jgi:hypothetical protein
MRRPGSDSQRIRSTPAPADSPPVPRDLETVPFTSDEPPTKPFKPRPGGQLRAGLDTVNLSGGQVELGGLGADQSLKPKTDPLLRLLDPAGSPNSAVAAALDTGPRTEEEGGSGGGLLSTFGRLRDRITSALGGSAAVAEKPAASRDEVVLEVAAGSGVLASSVLKQLAELGVAEPTHQGALVGFTCPSDNFSLALAKLLAAGVELYRLERRPQD